MMPGTRSDTATAGPLAANGGAPRLLKRALVLAAAISWIVSPASAQEPASLVWLQDAIFESGRHIPPQVNEYYFFEIETAMETPAATAELEGLLRAAHEEQTYIGIVGQQAARNLEIVRASLGNIEAGAIEAATIIYLGPDTQRREVEALVAPTGARLIFSPYE